MKPILKKVLVAVAAKEIYERIQEAREPRRPSLPGRLFKLGLVAGLAAGAYYAYRNGLLGGLGKGSEDYEGAMTVSRPDESVLQSQPVTTPTTQGMAPEEPDQQGDQVTAPPT